MKTATYTGLQGQPIVVEYDESAPCRICGKPVIEASMGGTDVCPWCDSGFHRDGSRWTYQDAIQNRNTQRQSSEMTKAVYKAFNMPLRAVLSTRPNGFMGDVADWDKAEAILQDVLRNSNLDFTVNEGDGAFYGPKIDFVVKDSQQREWQTATIQLDFQLPKNFGLEYKGQNNESLTPIVVHRAMYGSFERFIAILLEHYQGLPFWLSPTQIVVMPIGQDQVQCAKAIKMAFELGMGRFRTELDDSNRTLPQKIAMAQERKIPYMLVVGKREVENNVVSVRTLDGKQSIKSVHEFTSELYDKGRFHFGMFKKNVH